MNKLYRKWWNTMILKPLGIPTLDKVKQMSYASTLEEGFGVIKTSEGKVIKFKVLEEK